MRPLRVVFTIAGLLAVERALGAVSIVAAAELAASCGAFLLGVEVARRLRVRRVLAAHPIDTRDPYEWEPCPATKPLGFGSGIVLHCQLDKKHEHLDGHECGGGINWSDPT